MTRTENTRRSEYDYSLHYRIWHDESDQHAARMAALHRDEISPFLPTDRASAVVDIGCGMGFALLALRELGFADVCGVDMDPAQVESCRRRGLPVKLVEDTPSFLQRHPEVFNVVLMLDVLEHVPVPEQIRLMRAVCEATMPGGRAIISAPNANSIIAARLRYIDYTHQCSFTEHSLRFVLANAGFETVAIGDGVGPKRPPLRLWKRSSRLGFRKWLVRYLWRQVLAAEVSDVPRTDAIPISPHLWAVAIKAPAVAVKAGRE